MDNMLKNCFIARLCAVFALAFPGSIPGKIAAFCKRCYHDSVTRRVFHAFFSVTPKIVFSKLYKLFYCFNKALFGFGAKLLPAFEESIFLRACRAVFSSRIICNSTICSFFKKLGMRKFLIAIFALYLPIDVIVRDVLKIGFLSSIWDEAFMIFCIGYILYRIMTSSELIKPRVTPVDMPLLFFVSVGILLVAVVSPKMGPAIGGWRAVCQFMLWFYVLTRLIENDDDFRTLYFTMCAMATVIAFHGIYQYITKAPMP
ncbi:MAG: hypothetical protein E7441_07760, partial [Ruminococcaceae bacterium]|nr:hypothetical protein [Oscillospiraceae bacterium]